LALIPVTINVSIIVAPCADAFATVISHKHIVIPSSAPGYKRSNALSVKRAVRNYAIKLDH
jgi:hypothetical protein